MPGGYSIRRQDPEDTRPADGPFCEPPKELNYELWMGKTPVTPYFRGANALELALVERTLAGGNFADYAHHLIDIAQWAHGSEDTLADEVEGTGTFGTEGLVPADTDLQ